MPSNVRIFLRRTRGSGAQILAPEVVIARDRAILAVLRESDRVGARLVTLLYAPASQVPSRAAWLSALATTSEEHEIIDAIVSYREAGDYVAVDRAAQPRETVAFMRPAMQAQAFGPG